MNPVLAAERHSQAQLVEALESHPELLRLAELETSRVLPKNGNATRHRFRPGQSERNVFRNVPLEMPESVESRLCFVLLESCHVIESGRMHSLNTRNRRTDFQLDNESTVLIFSNSVVRRSIDYTARGLVAASNAEKLLAVELDQDDGANIRVTLGDLNAQERNEWIETGSRVLDLTDGVFVASAGGSYVSCSLSEKEAVENENEFYQLIGIRPGRYQVTVYTHVTSYNGLRLTRRHDWIGFLSWARSSRPKVLFPQWLIEYAHLHGEDLSEISENQIDGPETDDSVQFVVQLKPVGDTPENFPLNKRGALQMQQRLPEKCPLGIRMAVQESSAKIVKTRSSKQPVRASQKLAINIQAATEEFKKFAEALFDSQIDQAAEFFVPEVHDQAAEMLTSMRNRRKRWEPLRSVRVDTKNTEETLAGWQSCSEEGRNLFAKNTVSEVNFVGDLVCQFGNFRSTRIPLILTAAIVQVDGDLRLAGIYFSG